MMIDLKPILLFITTAMMITGCSKPLDDSDLVAYFDSIKSTKKSTVQPIPEFKTKQPYFYSSENLKSPFLIPKKTVSLNLFNRKDVKPDFFRKKTYLENFDIASFVMVGHIKDYQNRMFGLLSSQDQVHKVSVGDYIGRNYGKITAITANAITITEIVPSEKDKWAERVRIINLMQAKK